jgi:hypothetical protein
MSEIVTKTKLLKIQQYCDNFKHCGDYGLFYLDKSEPILYVVLGDADGTGENSFSDFDQLEKFMEELDLTVGIFCEHNPTEDSPDDYVFISYGAEVYENWETGDVVNSPKSMCQVEKIMFDHYLESLPE